ncbi:MAG TPA: hypothetical protein VK762_34525 [Polyangiaceae bacterium]|nr:hypothetical protein [Polyangiaceae bacterium]
MAAQRVFTLLGVAIAVAGVSACGGKLLSASDAGESSEADGANSTLPPLSGGGGGAVSGSSSSGGTVASSSSSSGAVGGSSGGATSSSSGASGVTCTTPSQCPGNEVCCATIMMTTNCQLGPCPSTPIGPIQLCTSDTDCLTRGDTCGALAVAPTLPIKICNAPPVDAGMSCSSFCTGCCDLNGVCNMGGSLDACGAKGLPCAKCAGTNVACEQGACIGLSPDAG